MRREVLWFPLGGIQPQTSESEVCIGTVSILFYNSRLGLFLGEYGEQQRRFPPNVGVSREGQF